MFSINKSMVNSVRIRPIMCSLDVQFFIYSFKIHNCVDRNSVLIYKSERKKIRLQTVAVAKERCLDIMPLKLKTKERTKPRIGKRHDPGLSSNRIRCFF